MATAQRVSSLAASRTASVLRNLGDEVRQGRLSRGLSQLEVARVASISQAKVSQIETASLATVSIRDVCHLLATVGLELSARAYPAGPPLRDAAHRALLERLRARIGQSVRWKFEVPFPITGGLRAWDAVMELANVRVAVEAETRVRDVQALQRRVSLKLRDDPNTTRVVLLIADTRSNREMVRAEARILSEEYPLSPRAMLSSLSEGRAPESSGVVLL